MIVVPCNLEIHITTQRQGSSLINRIRGNLGTGPHMDGFPTSRALTPKNGRVTLDAITMDVMEKAQPATSTIYIRLLEEAVTCIRPTEAEALEDGTYRVLPAPNYDPSDEVWEFVPGSRVHCESFDDSNGAYLLAIAEAGVDPEKKGRSNIAVLQDAIEYRHATGHLLWRINTEDIVLVAEYTTTEGPWGDDWFLVFGLAHKTPYFFTFPISSDGIEILLELLRVRFSTDLKLTNNTEWKSVVLWPKAIEGMSLFEFSQREPRNWRERLRTWYDGFIKEPHLSPTVSNYLHGLSTGDKPVINRKTVEVDFGDKGFYRFDKSGAMTSS